jgi:hypothetical protein
MAKATSSNSSKSPKFKAGVSASNLMPKRGVSAPGQKDTGTKAHAKAEGRRDPSTNPDFKPNVSSSQLMPKRGVTAPGQRETGNSAKQLPEPHSGGPNLG